MGTYATHQLVKHKKDKHHVFMILDELTSVPQGGPSLFRCMPLDDESKLYKYLETDLFPVTLEQAQNDPDLHDLGDYR
jgi:hypothetical protein